jgi:protein-S-isoprenylcysteine O-methyltransferase Ste14
VDLFVKWAQRRHGWVQRLVALLLAGVVVVALIPYLLIDAGLALDARFGLARLPLGVLRSTLGLLLALPGMGLALWSIYVQFVLAEGTPIPAMPTRKLVSVGPFACCRNPMSLGTILAYLGAALWSGSPGGILVMLALSGLLLGYNKIVEERELEARFGGEYVEYRRAAPFLIPRLACVRQRLGMAAQDEEVGPEVR